MSRAIKELIEKDLSSQYAEMDSMLVVNLHGLTGNEANAFRGELRKQDIEVHVVKNAAVKRALTSTPLEPLAASLEGPCAFVTCAPGPVDTAKELLRLVKEFPSLELKTGLVEGEAEILSVEDIAKRKSKAELHGEIIMLAASPGRRIVGQLLAGGKIAGCIKAVIDKLENGETISKVA